MKSENNKKIQSPFIKFCITTTAVVLVAVIVVVLMVFNTNSFISIDPDTVTVSIKNNNISVTTIITQLENEEQASAAGSNGTPNNPIPGAAGDINIPGVPSGPMYGSGAGSGDGVLVKTFSGWLNLYDDSTVAGNYYSIETSTLANYRPAKWSMGEGNGYTGNRYAKERYTDQTVTRPNGASEGYVDGSGRYWVAVGPKVTNKDFDLSVATTSDNAGYGKFFDLVVKDKSSGNTYYIPCKSGDCKVHTYPTGVIQTGTKIPGTESAPSNNDGSLVEWVGVTPSIGADLGDAFELIEIRVYE